MTTVETRPSRHRNARPNAQAEAASYFEFLYGWGVAPGVDFGALGAYTKVPTGTGCVYRQDFERGIGLGNLGDEAAVVVLEHPYLDLFSRPRRASDDLITPRHLASARLKALQR